MQQPIHNPVSPQPWYRFPMVWMIIMLPAIVVVASIVTMVIAHQNAPDILPKDSVSLIQADSQKTTENT